MLGSTIRTGAIFGALMFSGQAEAGNAPGTTPANAKPLPNIIYRVAYWADAGDFKSYPSINTTVVITAIGTAKCNFQVEWVSANNNTMGYTGIDPNYEGLQTQVLTSLGATNYGGYPPLPIIWEGLGIPFVYSNMNNPSMFGSANVRTDCAVGTKALVAAYLAAYNSAPAAGNGQIGAAPNALASVPVTSAGGNNGD